MTSLVIAIAFLNTAAAAITCWYALCGLNACTRSTPGTVRLSFAAIAVGAFATMLHPPELTLAEGTHTLVMIGIAVGFLANRRQCVCLNCPARAAKRKPAPRERHGSKGESGGHPA